MAYCSNCGAYIPDGQTKCLACGFDEAAEKAASASAAQTAKKNEENNYGSSNPRYDSEVLRRQLEEQRRKQKENSQKWAEAEYARRQQQEEAQRRAKNTYTNSYSGAKRANTTRSAGFDNTRSSGNTMALISYLWGLWLIPLIFNRDDPFTMFHVKQGIVLSIAATIGTIVGSIFGLGWAVSIARIYMMVKGIKNASAGMCEPLPYIGEFAAKF